MHCSRNIVRSPGVVRVVRPSSFTRNASFFPGPVFPRFHGPAWSAANDFAPFFRLFDESNGPRPSHQHNALGFQPRFDVREVGETYELRGELPGVESNNVEVEFTDPQTLVIRGRTEHEYTSGTPPTASTEAAKPEAEATETTKATAEADNSDAASTYSTGSYQKPSVEEEGASEAQPTPAESTAEAEQPKTEVAAPTEQQQQPASRYWVSERSTGSFQRVFKFPAKVDQDAVKASLKNGILSIVVPKAPAPEAKKITVE